MSSGHQKVVEALSPKPTTSELEKAIKQLPNGKTPGDDGISAGIYKCGSDLLTSKFCAFINFVWERGSVPQHLKDASIVHLYKHKGNRCVCDNHRGISLLSVTGKILARVIPNRLNISLSDLVLPETQCGFRSGRGTVDMIFSLRQLQEKIREGNKELYIIFVDLAEALDTVLRDALWKVLAKLGVPEKMLNVIVSFREGMKVLV